MKDSKWGFAMVLRQWRQEEIFRQALGERGVTVESGWECTDVQVHDHPDKDGYKIKTVIEYQGPNGKTTRTIISKFLIAADGGKSFIRRSLSVPFDGSSTETSWVRVDGVVETDIPKARGYCAIESRTHGNVLWQAMDHGSTRIGFALRPEREALYAEFERDVAVKEAIEAVKPFKVEFQKVEWWTKYVVQQRIARRFSIGGRVFLVGDAAHVHSSGAAQGLNVGIMDSVNLAWKLALVVQGRAKKELLSTYEVERRPVVERLLKYNKDISRLMTGQLPEVWEGDEHADTNIMLAKVMKEAGTFNTGLGIEYSPNEVLVQDMVKGMMVSVKPGQRAPDVKIQKPGAFEDTRLLVQMPNLGIFYVLVFAGDVNRTGQKLASFMEGARKRDWMLARDTPVEFVTIFGSEGASSPFELIGQEPLGKAFFDNDLSAHGRFGVNLGIGAVFIIRPDGWVGTVEELQEKGSQALQDYFRKFLIAPEVLTP